MEIILQERKKSSSVNVDAFIGEHQRMNVMKRFIINERPNYPFVLLIINSSSSLYKCLHQDLCTSHVDLRDSSGNMHKWAILTTIYIIHLIQMHARPNFTRARTHYHSPWDYKGNKTVTGCVLHSVRVLSHEMRMFLGDSI